MAIGIVRALPQLRVAAAAASENTTVPPTPAAKLLVISAAACFKLGSVFFDWFDNWCRLIRQGWVASTHQSDEVNL
jgi:hypothetical protein